MRGIDGQAQATSPSAGQDAQKWGDMDNQSLTSPLTSPTTVGRERELAALDELLAQARAGVGGVVCAAGEAGVGKSRLAAEAVARATAQGFAVLQANCFEPDHALPYAALIDLLRTDVGPLAPSAAQDRLGPLAPHLIGLLPEYAALLPQLAPPAVLAPQDERQRIAQAFIQFFAHRATAGPLLVVVEDLHWGDEASLAVLLALARRLRPWPLLLMVTLRSEEADTNLAAWLVALDRERLALRLQLRRLDYEQADAMLRAIFQQRWPIRGDFLSALYRLTEGNPFFIEEVLTTLIAHGDIYLAAGHWERKPLAELQIPPSVQAAVQVRVTSLDPLTRQLARLAAIIGRRFDFELLRRLTDNTEADLLGQIKALLAAQLVVEDAPDQFAFRHALTRAALYADLLGRERRALHERVAAALQALANERGPEFAERWAADLAGHWFAAGSWEQATHYGKRAAERAQRLHAPAAAVEQLTLVIEATRHLGKPPPAELCRARGHAHEILGDAEAALADYQAALAQAEAAGDRREQWQTLLAIGFYYAAHDATTMGAYLRAALDLARTLDDSRALGQSLNRYGNWHLFLEQPGEALGYHHEALAIFAAAGDRAGLAATHDLLGVTQIMGCNKPAAVRHYHEAITLFRECDDRPGLVSALATMALRGISYYHTTTAPADEDYGAWLRDGEAALQLARQIGWRAGEANALVYLALIQGAHGDYGQAAERAATALALAAEIGHSVWIAGATMVRGALALDLLEFGEARGLLEQALHDAQALGTFFTRRIAAYLAMACVAQGDLAGATAAMAPLLGDTTAMETQGQRIAWLARAELALAQDRPTETLLIAERLIATTPHIAERGPACIPSLWQLQGEALAALGRHADAEAALLAAAAGAERLGLLPTRWRIQRSLGRLYQAAGRRTLARQAYTEAARLVALLAERIADKERRARFQQAATALLPRSAADAPRQDPAVARLTRREREVAILIAQGKTSREIAEALVLGERTIETHTSNILGKLGFRSRREIIAWAMTAGLAHRVE
jgi:DNA-binding CsgD family transcriptional regulator